MGQGRGLAGVIIARHCQDPAMAGCAKRIGVFDDIHATVNSRAFAIPHPKNAVVAGTGEQIGLLAAPNCGCRQFLIDPGLKVDVVFLEPGSGFPHGLVNTTNR